MTPVGTLIHEPGAGFWVELSCRVLSAHGVGVAGRTYYDARTGQASAGAV